MNARIRFFGVLLVGAVLWGTASGAAPPERPNILWITCEDISPNLGCYGDPYAVTPNLDRLAAQGVRYTHAFSVIGVCAPSRSCLITGMYPPSIGTHHMRCQGTLPDFVRCFPEYLRGAGYYCTNNSKTDYNFQHPPTAWDESSGKAHWRRRKPEQPFFAVFNFTSCHESQIRLGEAEYRKRTADFTTAERHDPARAPLPPYHPDTPEVRRDWARYADMITYMDREVGNLLAQLEADGLAEETIVFFFSDHGAGMPRSKRWLYDSSLRVPFFVRFPERYRSLAPAEAGQTTDRLASFVDFAPTVLSLAGVDIPTHLQGEPFLGSQATRPRQYIFGFRDRMDERYDMQRAVRDQRYKYIRNFMPHVTWAQHVSYMYEMPTMRVWQRRADEGTLTGPQRIFFQPTKPVEELYDTAADPHEIHNLAADPAHREVLQRMRQALGAWMVQTVDLGLLPEADLRTRFGDRPPYQAVRSEPGLYPQERLLAAAELANRMDPAAIPDLVARLADSDPAIRWWGAVGLGAMGVQADPASPSLLAALDDPARIVRVAAAGALCRTGRHEPALPVLAEALEDRSEWVRLAAAIVLDSLDGKANPVMDRIQAAQRREKGTYVARVLSHMVPAESP